MTIRKNEFLVKSVLLRTLTLAVGVLFTTQNMAIADASFDGPRPDPVFPTQHHQVSDPLQGVASFMPQEIAKISVIWRTGTQKDYMTVLNSMVQAADAALGIEPVPYIYVTVSGKNSNYRHIEQQAWIMFNLATTYQFTGNRHYYDQLRRYLVSWAQSNRPTTDAYGAAVFVPMFRAYDLVRSEMTSDDRALIDGWLLATADTLYKDQEAARTQNEGRFYSYQRSYALWVIGTAGCVVQESRYVRYVTDKSGFLDHIGKNLRTFPNEPPSLGYDYHLHKAYHYVALNMKALSALAVLIDRIGHVSGNPYDIRYNPYSVDVNDASLESTLWQLLPFAAGEKFTRNEYVGSLDPGDPIITGRAGNNIGFNNVEMVPVLEQADYFFATLSDPRQGRTYDLPRIVLNILVSFDRQFHMPWAYPTNVFFLNTVISPYMTKL